MHLRSCVLEVVTNHRIRWIGSLKFQGLFDDQHSFVIEPIDQSYTRFTQTEKLSGVLVPIFGAKISHDAFKDFTAMNQAMKTIIEMKGN